VEDNQKLAALPTSLN